MFGRINDGILTELRNVCGDAWIFTDSERLAISGRDETEDLEYLPEAVAAPADPEEISALLKICNQYKIPVTARGGGTGLSGAALPVMGGLVISLERLNKILSVDEQNLQATVEAGVITQNLIDAAAKKGLLYPVDPSSKGSSFLGGNIAHGSGGPRVVKYGTIREYVLNLEVVLPAGDIIWTGANTLKYAAGYNLTQMMIGAEGTLGIITKAVLKLIPLPAHSLVMLASFPSNEAGCGAVPAIFMAGVTPSALEFMERKGVEWVARYEETPFEIKPEAQAFLLIELSGADMDVMFQEAEKVNAVLEAFGCFDVLLGDTASQKDAIWRIRRVLPLSVRANSVYKEEDTVVPRAHLPVLITGIKEIGKAYGFESVCYGHAGDGNLHVNIIRGQMSDEDWNIRLKEGIREIFKLTVSLGGTISGEHGIGIVQREFMDIKYSVLHLDLMRGIKSVFDPQGILNPGKIF